MNMII